MKGISRRNFLLGSAALGAGALMSSPSLALAGEPGNGVGQNVSEPSGSLLYSAATACNGLRFGVAVRDPEGAGGVSQLSLADPYSVECDSGIEWVSGNTFVASMTADFANPFVLAGSGGTGSGSISSPADYKDDATGDSWARLAVNCTFTLDGNERVNLTQVSGEFSIFYNYVILSNRNLVYANVDRVQEYPGVGGFVYPVNLGWRTLTGQPQFFHYATTWCTVSMAGMGGSRELSTYVEYAQRQI